MDQEREDYADEPDDPKTRRLVFIVLISGVGIVALAMTYARGERTFGWQTLNAGLLLLILPHILILISACIARKLDGAAQACMGVAVVVSATDLIELAIPLQGGRLRGGLDPELEPEYRIVLVWLFTVPLAVLLLLCVVVARVTCGPGGKVTTKTVDLPPIHRSREQSEP